MSLFNIFYMYIFLFLAVLMVQVIKYKTNSQMLNISLNNMCVSMGKCLPQTI